MAVPKPTKVAARPASRAAPQEAPDDDASIVRPAPHSHRLAGQDAKPDAKPAAKPAMKPAKGAALAALLGGLNANTKTQKPKKNAKPLITLDDKAKELHDLQKSKAMLKTLEGHVAELESDLLPLIEEQRLDICRNNQEYIGSIHVQANGNDAEGNPINAGQALYYVQNRHSAFNPFALSTDDDLQKDFEGKATLKDEAIASFMQTFGIDQDAATQMFDDRMKVSHTVSLAPGALENEDVIAVLREHLAQYLVSDTKAVPTEAFHQKSSYNMEDMQAMEALNNIGLAKRAKAAIKPSGAPD